MLALDVHADGPDEAEQFSPHSGHDILVWHASVGESSIAPVESVLGLPSDLFHRLLDAFLACPQRAVDSRSMPGFEEMRPAGSALVLVRSVAWCAGRPLVCRLHLPKVEDPVLDRKERPRDQTFPDVVWRTSPWVGEASFSVTPEGRLAVGDAGL